MPQNRHLAVGGAQSKTTLPPCCCSCSVVAMETRQYAVGDVITMRLMRREKGSLVAMPSSQWEKVEEPVRFGGERQQSLSLLDQLFKRCSETSLLSSSRYSSQPVFKAAAGFALTGSEDGGGREGRPADAAQPGRRRSGLLHPERPLSAEGSNSSHKHCYCATKPRFSFK